MKEVNARGYRLWVKEQDVFLPPFLYQKNPTTEQNQGVSPYAIFDPVASTSDSGWISSTTPMSKPPKRVIVVGSNSFTFCREESLHRFALLASLRELGFEIYIKHEKGLSPMPEENSGIMEMLNHTTPTTQEDYKTITNTYQVARNEVIMLGAHQALAMYSWLLVQKLGGRLNKYESMEGATDLLGTMLENEKLY